MEQSSHTFALALLLGALSVVHAAEPGVGAWLGENLIANPGFEEDAGEAEDTPASWQVWRSKQEGTASALDSEVLLEGGSSLRLVTSASGVSLTARSAPVAVTGGALYLFSVGFRQEGFSTVEKGELYCGVSSYPRLVWLDEAKRVVGQSATISRFPYGPCPWDLRDAFELAPDTARFAQVEATVSNNSVKHAKQVIPATLWIDAVQLRLYTPPPSPEWARGETEHVVEGSTEASGVLAYFVAGSAAFRCKGGTWSRVVTDPAAERGSALEASAGVGKGLMAHGPYDPHLPAGMGVYRMRVRAHPGPAEDAGESAQPVGYVDVLAEHSGSRLKLPVRPRPAQDGREAGYDVFEGDFILRDNGWWCPRVYTHGEAEWRIDSIKVFQVLPLPDRELLNIYPGSGGNVPDDLAPTTYQEVLGGGPRPVRGLVVAGLGTDWYRLSDACKLLHRDMETHVAWVSKPSRTALVAGLPENAAELFEYCFLCLGNVSMNALPLKHKNAICEYVRRGGALVTLGGHQAYGRGAWRGSLIEDVLPVTPARTPAEGFVTFPAGCRLSVPPDDVSWLQWIRAEPMPYVHNLHRAVVKPAATVFMRAGEEAFLVGGEFGRGRVVCVLGRASGDPVEGQTPFWAWNAWPHLLRDVFWWAMRYPPEEARAAE